MATEIGPDGQVQAPLNITAPAPSINLNGFHWDTVDQKIHGTFLDEHHVEEAANGAVQIDGPGSAQHMLATPVLHQRVTTGGAPAVAPGSSTAPQSALEAQLSTQLGLIPGKKLPALPLFPLTQFQGPYAGNGFNLIFRPRSNDDKNFPPSKNTEGPSDNILELNLTTEQLTFGQCIGQIPNRGLGEQSDITLGGFPYLQTVQDATNPKTGKGDSAVKPDIHFETGMFLNVPASANSPKNEASVVRMGSIPHGTTINAQCFVPSGSTKGGPVFDKLDTTPFGMGNPKARFVDTFPSMKAENKNTHRLPQNLDNFIKTGTITSDIIQNPNIVLQNAVKNQKILETITFEVSTGPPQAVMNGGGTANISFLAGTQQPITTAAPGVSDTPNAHADFMTCKFWIETVQYKVNVDKLTTKDPVLLRPQMDNDLAPTPQFLITPPPNTDRVPFGPKTINVPGIQIQYSQTVNLNFGNPIAPAITWPHVSCATLIPKTPQLFQIPS